MERYGEEYKECYCIICHVDTGGLCTLGNYMCICFQCVGKYNWLTANSSHTDGIKAASWYSGPGTTCEFCDDETIVICLCLCDQHSHKDPKIRYSTD